ncbi:MAG: hypothetical protein KAR83_05850, partial [Thermodesulfovibrionales bacterium]|nr:hypothetical protein [Thermodesulfovibrionales bacterium]
NHNALQADRVCHKTVRMLLHYDLELSHNLILAQQVLDIVKLTIKLDNFLSIPHSVRLIFRILHLSNHQ